MSAPKVLVIRSPGTNCDAEMVRAFTICGGRVDLVHLDLLVREPSRIDSYDIIGFPGGFSYGDDVASGRVFAMKCRVALYPALRAAVQRG
ncbi:MAG: phosphoribosylformylglycinamidine synthase subunit PurQ, partial [Planctomycetota bacterium]|nr:phosphoribosylformylglycinamidine synthase subunit PurQ [Planctomycetota bacterium]